MSFYELFLHNLQESTWTEGIAVFFGLLSVWFARKENILVYPTGIINVLLYVYICYHAGLYADMGINAFYFVVSVYGWYNWARVDQNKHHIPISRLSIKGWILNSGGVLLFFVPIAFLLHGYTNSTVPVWDAFTTAIFIISMWLMALKKIENWLGWIIGDMLVIPLFFSKGLVLSSFQYVVFLILAVMGYIEWRNKLKHYNANDKSSHHRT